MLIIAGPCAVESHSQAMRIAEFVYNAGANMFRGGAYKPRSSPNSFQGLGEEGLFILNDVRKFMPVVTEATQVEHVSLVADNCDMIQIGSRNMHNVELLKAVGRTGKDVLLKRGYAAMIEEEWLNSYQYLERERLYYNNNGTTYMCERGIRSFDPSTRNVLDLSAVLTLKRYDKKVIVDPSHATGRPEMVIPLALAAVAVGADGIIVEVHDRPDEARCDGHQAIGFTQFVELMDKVTALNQFMENNYYG